MQLEAFAVITAQCAMLLRIAHSPGRARPVHGDEAPGLSATARGSWRAAGSCTGAAMAAVKGRS